MKILVRLECWLPASTGSGGERSRGCMELPETSKSNQHQQQQDTTFSRSKSSGQTEHNGSTRQYRHSVSSFSVVEEGVVVVVEEAVVQELAWQLGCWR